VRFVAVASRNVVVVERPTSVPCVELLVER
jgi:hypothetical protein